jgi:hypothetical protein
MEQQESGKVLLGELDEWLEQETDGIITYTSSKIGGMPFWIDHTTPSGHQNFAYSESVSLSGVVCQQCHSSQNMTLVLQAYAPLHVTDHNESLRVLYIFVCLASATCANSPKGWIVLRGGKQQTDPNNTIVTEASSSTSSMNVSMDPSYSKNHVISDETRRDVSIMIDEKKNHVNVNIDVDADVDVDIDVDTHQIEERIEQLLSLRESKTHNATTNSSSSTTGPNPQKIPSSNNVLSTPMFVPITLYIDEEENLIKSTSLSSWTKEDQLTRQVHRLLHDYEQQQQHESMQFDQQSSSSTEQYSKSPFTPEFKTFHRFQKVLQQYPLQIIRYCINGTPLLFTSRSSYVPQPTTIPSCPYCGYPRRFELQIMPTLIPQLKLVQTLSSSSSSSIPPPSIEFSWGTLLIYTCQQDCSSKPSKFSSLSSPYDYYYYYHKEYVHFQPDLDHVPYLHYNDHHHYQTTTC